MATARSTLLFVGLNPPATSGARTRQRVDLAREILGFTTVEFGNIFAYPTLGSSGVAGIGAAEDGWLAARVHLDIGIRVADAALLAYGIQAPSGSARRHFRDQVAWLEHNLAAAALPVWLVGGAPHHPSRWQRYTHRVAPDLPFQDALRAAFVRREPSADS